MELYRNQTAPLDHISSDKAFALVDHISRDEAFTLALAALAKR